jgi:sterol desaturase/sphingolipid hydroxylase (fatty acid hydroxylase superfamily)
VFGLGGTISPAYFVLALLGIPFWMFVAVAFVGNLWGIFNHTRLVRRMGWLDEILCTPSNHRVHHGIDAKYLDRNYGQTLLIWDRLFGTFQREEEEPTYGLVKQQESDRIWDIQTAGPRWLWDQLKSAPTWQVRWHYLVRPPGWRHDGCHQTAEAIRAGQPGCLTAA